MQPAPAPLLFRAEHPTAGYSGSFCKIRPGYALQRYAGAECSQIIRSSYNPCPVSPAHSVRGAPKNLISTDTQRETRNDTLKSCCILSLPPRTTIARTPKLLMNETGHARHCDRSHVWLFPTEVPVFRDGNGNGRPDRRFLSFMPLNAQLRPDVRMEECARNGKSSKAQTYGEKRPGKSIIAVRWQ